MKRTLSALLFALLIGLTPALARAADNRYFEIRTYYAAEGKLDGLLARFRDHTCTLFEKHGMVNIGYWVPVDNKDNTLIYILAYPSKEAHDKSWKEFLADPDWKAAQKASEANGRLVNKVDSRFLLATDYSPMVTPSKSGERLFELRTYTASSGKLENLNARFRDHTCQLFEKHGIVNFGYWTLDKEQKDAEKKGAADTLVYIIIHKDDPAAKASWKAFQGDPDWVTARKASEEKAGGSLTIQGGVKSVYMKPTDFSPAK